MAAPDRVQCSLCNGAAHLVADSVPGYQEERIYAIYECEGCLASFASPLEAVDSIYGHIYRHIHLVPGYSRYYHYAHEVLRKKKALDYLSEQEESYWAVARHLRKRRTTEDRLRILEVGCGLGYFSYALHLDGFNVRGVDISSRALAWAREHYGPFYADTTLRDIKTRGDRYDVIIMNQLIEHVPDVHGFVSEALALLAPKGELIITTPNKSAHPDADWETELPPVHLWWFGEDSMKFLADRHNCTATFIDFEPFYDRFYRRKTPCTPVKFRKPVFNAEGTLLVKQPLSEVSFLRKLLKHSGFITLLRRLRTTLDRNDKWHGTRGPISAVILRCKGSEQ